MDTEPRGGDNLPDQAELSAAVRDALEEIPPNSARRGHARPRAGAHGRSHRATLRLYPATMPLLPRGDLACLPSPSAALPQPPPPRP